MQRHQVKVINNNDFAITDYYDGIAYHFKPNEPKGINLPLDAASHIFGVDFPADADACKSEGLRENVWEYVIRRWGWNSHDAAKLAISKKLFNKFEFKPVIFTITEVITGGDSEDPPAPRESKIPGKNSKFKPRVEESAAEDEAEVG